MAKSNEPKLIIADGAKGGNNGRKKPKMPIEEYIARLSDKIEEDNEGEGAGKIFMILSLWRAGYERTEIVAAGYNRSTVYRQVGEYEKLRKAPATHYQGFEIFESRVARVMQRKGLSMEEAIDHIFDKDLND